MPRTSTSFATLASRMPNSLYLAAAEAVLKGLSRFSLNHRWQEWVKKRLNVTRSPMWAAELFQITSLGIGFLILTISPVAGFPVFLRGVSVVVALYQIVGILVFALRWVLLDRRPVKDFRRSLIMFGVNLLELGLFGAILLRNLSRFPAPESPWKYFYGVLQSVFSFSLPTIQSSAQSSERIAAHLVLISSWLLVFVVIVVVLNGIQRGEESEGPAA